MLSQGHTLSSAGYALISLYDLTCYMLQESQSLDHDGIGFRVDEWVIMVFSTNLGLVLHDITICLNILGWYLNNFS